jgi:kynurenine formamidase
MTSITDIDLARLKVIDLEQPRRDDMPIHPNHRPGYFYALHRRHQDGYSPPESGPRTSASGMIVCMEHSGTHIDALSHQSEALVLCGGVPVDATVQTTKGFTRHGVEEIAPIVAHAVLLDVPALHGVESLEPGYAVTAAELAACCERQGVALSPGEVLLVYTGNQRFWHDEQRYLAGPGMDASASRWAIERGALAVGADNMAWDVIGRWDDELGCYLPGHLLLLARHGIYILENLALAELVAGRHYRSLLICTPLKFVGATGSPVRPIALVDR